MSARRERSGWRDQSYSDWKRQLQFRPEWKAIGKWLYWCDVDALEYRHGKEGVALIELKYGDKELERRSSQCRVLLDLAARAGLPLFVVNYRYTASRQGGWGDWASWRFKITALNELARRKMGKDARRGVSDWMGEASYIKFLDALGKDTAAPTENLSDLLATTKAGRVERRKPNAGESGQYGFALD